MMGGNARTTNFLKECLADGLIKLLETKPIEKITIPEIAKIAQVGRTTYFRNFSSKNELLTFKLICLWERWADSHNMEDYRRYSVKNAPEFYAFNFANRELLSLIYKRGLQTVIYDAFYTVMAPYDSADPVECYYIRFYSYALFGLLDEWIKRDFFESAEEMTEIFEKMQLMS